MEFLSGQDIAAAQLRAPAVHRALADRHAGSGIIGDQAFLDIHLLQWVRIGTGRITRGTGVSAEGIPRASFASTWSRIVAAEGMAICFA